MENPFKSAKIEDRLPPQSIETEQCLLGSLMLDKKAILKVVDFLTARDFYHDSHRKIYEAIVELFEKGEPIDLITVTDKLKAKGHLDEIGGASYLTEIVNSVPTAAHVQHYAEIVQKKRILRDLIEASYKIAALGYEEDKDVELLLDEAEKTIFGISQRTLSQRFIPIKETLEEAFERIDLLTKQKGKLRGLPTGFRYLDNLLAGLQKSDLIILAARPSLGKSALALDIARHIAVHENQPVGIFSLEMSTDQIVDRMLAAQSGVDLWKIRTGNLSDDEIDNDFARLQHALGILSEAPIYIDDSAIANVIQMRAMARRLQADKGLGLLVVDYIQLIDPRDKKLGPVQQMTEISRSLKGLARELNIPVLAVSQLSRAVEQRSPQIPRLSDLRESGCVTGDTKILRADTGELIPIKDLIGKTNIPVLSLDENWKLREMKISRVFYSGKKMIYELKTRSGFKIKASGNHKFRKLDGWVRLDELAVGDLIATPKRISLSNPKNQMKPEEIILLAHLLGDGCVLPKQPIHYTSADLENINLVAVLAQKLFKIKPRIIRQKTWWHVYLPSPYRLSRGKHHPIITWYHELGLEPVHSFKKKIPQKIFSLDEEKTALFLKHLWATDGSIREKLLKDRKPSAQIYYSTTSLEMAEGVKHLLLRFGIRSKIARVRKGDYRPNYHILIQGRENQLLFLQRIGTFGRKAEIISKLISQLQKVKSNPNVEVIPKQVWNLFIDPTRKEKGMSWREFSAKIDTAYCSSTLLKSNVGLKRMEKISLCLQSSDLLNLVHSDVFWDEIISIKPLNVEEVYDATVPGLHNFVANDIIIHNSLEQDADVVMFIYREDKYKEDSLRKNIADIIVAKHRNGPVGKVELFFDERRVTFRTLEREEKITPESSVEEI